MTDGPHHKLAATDGDNEPVCLAEAIVEDERWDAQLGDTQGFTAKIWAAALHHEPRLRGETAVLFGNDAQLHDLNNRFRQTDKPTNVLSFPSGQTNGFLGDIAIAFDTCEREATEKGIALADHSAHLLIHGLLHLIGYDHETAHDAEIMEQLETTILANLGVADPYAETA